ncbi:MAG: hypothetical protein MUC42_00775, partial [Bryobacter sp.]|nr:hypothetical protein [Bryobacter sp.]
MALKNDGTVWVWGSNSYLSDPLSVKPLNPTQVTAVDGATMIAAGRDHSLALRRDGTVWTWGMVHGISNSGTAQRIQSNPVAVPGLSGM